MKKLGSATVVVILFAIVFMLYASSTYADVRHMRNQYEEYERDIIEKYETYYNKKVQEL
ncbi:MAG: hypothetical protein IJ272_04105 [Clostridia bacterium]|nr:hypothetical protein [Clostridia bacterium]